MEVIIKKLQIDNFSLLAFALSCDTKDASLLLQDRLLNPTKVGNQISFFESLSFQNKKFGSIIKEIRLFKVVATVAILNLFLA